MRYLLLLPLLLASAARAQQPAPPDGMVYVPAGEFQMGTNRGDRSDFNKRDNIGLSYNDARPQHQAQTGAFFIDVTEVTNAQYQKYCLATDAATPPHWIGGAFPDGEENYPVHHVNWYEARAYAKWVNKRLPTEIEWEKAARGTDGRRFPWGDEWNDALVTEAQHALAVGRLPGGASPYGALDMAGNVSEWTASWWQAYANAPTQQPDLGTKYKVARGGYWTARDMLGQTYYREAVRPQSRIATVGFRCAQDAPAPNAK